MPASNPSAALTTAQISAGEALPIRCLSRSSRTNRRRSHRTLWLADIRQPFLPLMGLARMAGSLTGLVAGLGTGMR